MSEQCYCGAHDCPVCYPYVFEEEPRLTSEEESFALAIETSMAISPEEDPAMLEALEDDCRRICSPAVYAPEILFQYILDARREVKTPMNPRVAVERYAELGHWVTLLHTLHPAYAQGAPHAR